jgi:predicted flap endonuclease-1-like 5' DNA nuclease
MTSLKMVEGIGEVFAQKLKESGVSSLEGFLATCKTKTGRDKLAEGTGISEKLILKWANHADLARIKGVGGQYAELLEAAGVDTVPELAKRKAENLLAKMTQVNEEKKLVRKLPVLKQVESWVVQAAALPRILQY